jgi:hypothetical protein
MNAAAKIKWTEDNIMTSTIQSFLCANGLWTEREPEQTDFCRSLMRILPDGVDSRRMACALETTLRSYMSNRMLLAKLCALLKQATGKGPTEIAMVLLSAAPDLGRSVSEVSKLIKAGVMWLDWPILGDIENPDKLATLKRVPNQLKAQIFESGLFPDGTPIRDLSCAELRAAVNALRPGQQPKPPTQAPLRAAKEGLIKLANAMSGLSELMLGIPEMVGTKEKIDLWYAELLEKLSTIPERVGPALVLRSSADNNRAVLSQVTWL